MTRETLPRIVTTAADPEDRDDVDTRGSLAHELQIVLATCPSNRGGSLSVAKAAAPGFCVIGRPLIPACDDCMLS
jgi:hypothetical protein